MEVKIEKLVYGGEGLGHQDGQTIFVPFVLPEEVVSVRALRRKKKFVRGRLDRVLTPSVMRVHARCQHFSVCGGCHYQHMPHEAQVETKIQILRETLRRIGKVQWDGEIIAHPSPPFGYRNRAQWRVRTLAGQTEIGYFQFASSALCAVEECPILTPRLAEVFEALRQLLCSGGMPAQLVEAEAFVDAAGEQVLLNADFANYSAPAEVIAKQLRDSLPRIESLLLHDASRDRFELFGPGFIRTQVNENNFCVGHFSFFQSNAHLLDQLARAVTDMPEVQESSCALDLYAGVGVFAVALAKRFGRVVAVESNEGAVRDLEANISLARVSAQAVCADVAKFLSSWPERPELVVLDPPRAGVEPAALSALVPLAPRRVHYVSCDPATLARDLAVLIAGGYRITEVHFFDMFPQTYHIETLVRLAR